MVETKQEKTVNKRTNADTKGNPIGTDVFNQVRTKSFHWMCRFWQVNYKQGQLQSTLFKGSRGGKLVLSNSKTFFFSPHCFTRSWGSSVKPTSPLKHGYLPNISNHITFSVSRAYIWGRSSLHISDYRTTVETAFHRTQFRITNFLSSRPHDRWCLSKMHIHKLIF